MANIVIRKRVSFDFLGDEYKDGYIILRSITYDENSEIIKQARKSKTVKKQMDFIKNTLVSRFISGEFPVEGKLQPMVKEDIGKLDNDSITTCFEIIVGGLSPKANGQL